MVMNFKPTHPPRLFEVGQVKKIQLKDCANIELDTDEQITFKTKIGGEFDVVRKSWGFYATPSLNGRLVQFGLRAVLVKSPGGKFYILLVEKGKESEFLDYMKLEKQEIISWLDTDDALLNVESKLKGKST
jgi:hypothetical protein